MKNTFSVPEVARKTGFTIKYIYDLVYSGRLKAEKTCGRWRISQGEVDAFLKKRGR